MAISAATVWEVRPATGANTNGGGFVPGASGTDYSQQAAAQYALTGVTTSGASATAAHASAASDMVGNIAQVISGTNFTPQFYQILSVVVGVSITFDRNVATGVGAIGVINIGGCLADLHFLLNDPAQTAYAGQAYQGAVNFNTIYLKGTFTNTVRLDYTNVVDFKLIGYGTTRGDGVRATITTATNSIPFFLTRGGSGQQHFENLIFSNTAGTRSQWLSNINSSTNPYYITFINCMFDGLDTMFSSSSATYYHWIFSRCEIKNAVTTGITFDTPVDVAFYDCWIHANGTDGVNIATGAAAGSVHFVRCGINANGGCGVKCVKDGIGNSATGLHFDNCGIVSNTGSGIEHMGVSTNVGQLLFLQNTVVYGNGAWGVKMAATISGDFVHYGGNNNGFGSNTSGNRQTFPTLPGDIALTSNPFTAPASGDFTLTATAGGGAACLGAGFPSTFP